MSSMFLLVPIFGSNVLHKRIMFAKLLYLILVSFHYNSLIIINHIGISVCTDDVPLLKVNFFHVRNFTDLSIFFCGACYRCISTDILPATCRCAGCLSACTMDCQSASTWPSRLTVGRIGNVLADWLSVG